MGTWARNSTWKYIKIGKEADDLPATPPSGKKTIDTTAEVDVSAYATAQVVDANLTAENIKKDVVILGQTGSYEGGGSSDYSTAEVTFNVTPPEGVTITRAYADNVMVPWYIDPQDPADIQYYEAASVFNTTEALKIKIPVGNVAGAFVGAANIYFSDSEETYVFVNDTPTISGNVTLDSDNNRYVITGDCAFSGNLELLE